MKKSEMIEQVAEKAQTSKAAVSRVWDAIFDSASGTIAEAVQAGQQVSIPGFGKFKPKTRPARKGRNPRTGATINIPERTVVSFTPGKALKDTLGGKSKGSRSAGGTKAKSGTTGKASAAKAGSSGGRKAASGGSAKSAAGAKKGGSAAGGRAGGSSRSGKK